MSRRQRSVILVTLVLSLGCSRDASRIDVQRIGAGEWMLLPSSTDDPVFQQLRASVRTRTRGERTPSLRFARFTDTITHVTPQRLQLQVGDSAMPLLSVNNGAAYVFEVGPQLVQSPGDARTYVFEHDHALWLFKAPDSVRKITRDDDVTALRAKQREGVVILYWSTHPVWSADGELLSYLSNRESVRTGGPGQSMWAIDLRTGQESALYNTPRVSVHTDAIYGEEFVFSSDVDAGVSSVHSRTRRVTKISPGYVAGAHVRGKALLINHDGRFIVFRESNQDTLPAPPAGRVWSPNAFFSPSGDRIAIFSTDGAGDYSLHVFERNNPNNLVVPVPGGPSYGPVWANESTVIFAAMQIGRDMITYRADIR